MQIVEKHISRIRVGDTILHNGEIKTLNANYLKRGGFMGESIWGDSYHSGMKPVKVVVITRALPSHQGWDPRSI